jgi:hypothetical protein
MRPERVHIMSENANRGLEGMVGKVRRVVRKKEGVPWVPVVFVVGFLFSSAGSLTTLTFTVPLWIRRESECDIVEDGFLRE